MIEIRNCSKAFGEIHAIDHVLMEIGERQIFGLVGTNGAGKSTLQVNSALHFQRTVKTGRRRNPGGSGTGL